MATVERELPKDCGCQTHTGPHWLHMDAITHEQNRKFLAQAKQGNIRAGFTFVTVEQQRLEQKAREMESMGLISYRLDGDRVLGVFDERNDMPSISAAIAQLMGAS
jgi:hypothetical protein